MIADRRADGADRGLFVARLDEPLLDAVLRMVKLLDTPEDIDVLAPVVQREIYYRMLRGELGHRLVDLAQSEGGNHRIVRAIEWLKQHYAAPLRIEELAEAVHMSPSALHHRFKAVTAMSPLQYQKHLRLHEARRLMFADGIECADCGSSGGLRECLAVQPRIPAPVRRAATRGDFALARNGRGLRVDTMRERPQVA